MANAGVVGYSEVLQPNATSGKTGGMTIATWSFVWVGASALILLFLHMAMMGRASR